MLPPRATRPRTARMRKPRAATSSNSRPPRCRTLRPLRCRISTATKSQRSAGDRVRRLRATRGGLDAEVRPHPLRTPAPVPILIRAELGAREVTGALRVATVTGQRTPPNATAAAPRRHCIRLPTSHRRSAAATLNSTQFCGAWSARGVTTWQCHAAATPGAAPALHVDTGIVRNAGACELRDARSRARRSRNGPHARVDFRS